MTKATMQAAAFVLAGAALLALAPGDDAAVGLATSASRVEINNGVLKAQLYLPDAQKGFYRGTRFDWSGVIGNLEYKGHRYYGPWFTKTDPTVNDFIYKGTDIVAGPCSAITGPVEEFSTDDKALGYDEAKPGGTFIKIGVGVLRKPQDESTYNHFRLYEIVDPGTWKVRTTRDRIELTHDVADPSSGYGYRYQKTIQFTQGRPDMVMDHKLKNTGRRSIASSVYNHNFLVLDGQPPGPDFVLKMPFEIKMKGPPNNALAEVRGNQGGPPAVQCCPVVDSLRPVPGAVYRHYDRTGPGVYLEVHVHLLPDRRQQQVKFSGSGQQDRGNPFWIVCPLQLTPQQEALAGVFHFHVLHTLQVLDHLGPLQLLSACLQTGLQFVL